MTYIQFLGTKKNIIIGFYIFNLLALFVNIFHIEGKYTTMPESSDNIPTDNTFWTREYIVIYEGDGTDSYSSGNIEAFNEQRFWPFVTFCAHGLINSNKYYHNPFYGIFIFYDYSEFIAYSVIFFLILYFIWNRKYNS